MALPPKKKYKSTTSRAAKAASEREYLRLMVRWTVALVIIPVIILGIKQLNPGIFYLGQGRVMQRFGKFPSAALAYEKAHEANPEKGIEALLDAAAMREENGQFDAVRDLAQKVLDSEDATPEQKAKAKLYMALVLLEASQPNFESAASLAEQARAAIEKDKHAQYRAWIVKGRCLTFAGDYRNAEEAFNSALDLKRLWAPEAHLYMGLMYAKKGETNQAIDEYDYGLGQRPSPRIRKLLDNAKAQQI